VQPLLTVDQAAETLGVSRSTIYNLIGSGQLPTVKLGRSRRISPESLAAYVRERESLAVAG
jgi:excisionase family DNA binding protein